LPYFELTKSRPSATPFLMVTPAKAMRPPSLVTVGSEMVGWIPSASGNTGGLRRTASSTTWPIQPLA
jgi:hypothetical protein